MEQITKIPRFVWLEAESSFNVKDALLESEVTVSIKGNATHVDGQVFSLLEKHSIWSAIVGNLYKKHHTKRKEEAELLITDLQDNSPTDYRSTTYTEQQKAMKAIRGKVEGIARSQLKKTEKLFGKRFKEYYDRLVARCVDDKIVRFHKAVFRVLGPKNYTGCRFPLISEAFYEENPFYINDVINYPAAAVAIKKKGEYSKWLDYLTGKEYNHFYDDNWFGGRGARLEPKKGIVVNSTFRKNLMKWPSGLSLDRAINVIGRHRITPKVALDSPVKFKVWIYGLEHNYERYELHQDCLELSTIKQYQRAAKLVGRYYHRKLDLRKTRDIVDLIGFFKPTRGRGKKAAAKTAAQEGEP